MSSFVDQAEYLRKKKEEILAKKKAEKEKNEDQKDTKLQAPIPFANDGSFLEKFKTMQNNTKTQQKTPTTSVKTEPLELTNDGSFLEKYKAMQQQSAVNVKVEPAQPKDKSSKLSSYSKAQAPVKMAAVFEKEADTPGVDDYEIARELAEKVHREGKQAEMIARIQGRTNPRYKFLFSDTSPVAKYYQTQLENFKQQDASSSASATITPAASSSAANTPKDTSLLSEFEKAKALVRAKAAAMRQGGVGAAGAVVAANVVSEEEKRRQKAIEEQKMMNEIYIKVIQQQMAAASEATRRQNKKRKHNDDPDKPKYEYDSDEDTEGGTWEHKKRATEMQKTAEKALELTDSARGKHHLSDFLPPDELEKFLEKVKAVKEGREADFSDYAKYKIGEENLGYKMLMKAGWEEGAGLGSKGEGITAPINKGKTSFDNGGIGTEKVAEVKKEDDDFEVYRKRMMLAYKFRPNPLNNPRRPYYE